ncbi:hypothetical protein BD560DRAFT_435672 [Blakeslea trispora]|nr:hypothetical protein BD560DRAFT_435672 [Blakeslea trispora]
MKTSSRNRSVFEGIHQNAIAKVKPFLASLETKSFPMKRRQKRDASLPEARTTFQVSERKRKRLQRKLRSRTACFADNKAMMTSLFEEEDVEENAEEDSCFRVLVPSWLESFFAALDSIHKKKNKAIRASRRREVVEKELPTGRHEKFPQWAIRS